MKTTILSLAAMIAISTMNGSKTWGQFVPKKPGDIIPQKPEDVFPGLPKAESGMTGNTRITFNYTILNDSGDTVRFKLPSGKVYILKPGETGSYKFTGYKPHATIHVYNTGKTYSLVGGNHKFWWMKSERRVAFDMNYQK